ncbi:MAG TPA: DedA family protein [Candidatus Nanoarchaeia archaeon]
MLDAFFAAITTWTLGIISTLGYFGIFMTMAIESACIPLPSEIIMPFSGFLVASGKFNFWLVVVVGAAGNLAGSALMYGLGFYGQERLVRRFVCGPGRFLVTEEELDLGERWFRKYGELIVLVSRIIPVVRTFISLPAGVARVGFFKFSFLTFLGSLCWSAFLAYLGVELGKNWAFLEPIFRKFDIAIVVLGIIVAAIFFYLKLKRTFKWKRKS